MNVLATFLLSLFAVPVMRLFCRSDIMSADHRIVFLASAGVLAFLALVVYLNNRLSPSGPAKVHNKFTYMFVIFAFTCVVDLFIGLELHGYVDEFMTFYFKEGEPYLLTSHGMIINYWDGTGHYLLCLALLYCINNRLPHRALGLYWVGSIMNSMPVLLLGGLTGKFGHKVKMSFFLNTPYVVMPLMFAYYVLSSPRTGPPPASSEKRRSPAVKLFDALLALGTIVCIVIHTMRGVAASGSPSLYFELYRGDFEPYLREPTNFGTIQAFQYCYYYIPASIAVIYAMCKPGCQWMTDIASLMAGGVMQGQLSYMVASLALRTDDQYRVPEAALPIFWAVNLAVWLVPHLVLVRALAFPRFFAPIEKLKV